MKIRNLLIISIIIMSVVSCATKTEPADNGVKYFRHMKFTETPFDKLDGIYPLSSEEAKEINHYRFTYNDEGNLTEVSYQRGELLLSYSSFGAASIKIEYSPGKEVYSYYDKDGKQIKGGGAWYAVYELDEEGIRSGMHFEDKEGNMMENRNSIAYYDWKILDDGMVQEKRYNLEKEETVLNQFCPFYELRFSYDEDGNPTRMANYMEDTLYDCTVENCGDVGVSYFLFENNEKGALTKFSVHNSTGQLSNLYWGWAKFEVKLDENGYVTERISYDQDDELLGGKSYPINQTVYDSHGAVLERRFLDAQRNLFERGNGAAIVKYTYDETGNPVDTTMMNAEEEIITSEV